MDPFVGEIRIVPFPKLPRSWAYCAGAALSIGDQTMLYSLIGTSFGGDGRSIFQLPDLRGRVPVGAGTGPGLTPTPLATWAGYNHVPVSTDNLPAHAHDLVAINGAGNSTSPNNAMLAAGNGTATVTVPANIPVTGVTDMGGRTPAPLQNGATSATASAQGNVNAYAAPGGTSARTNLHPDSISTAGKSAPLYNMQPYLALSFIIALDGIYPQFG